MSRCSRIAPMPGHVLPRSGIGCVPEGLSIWDARIRTWLLEHGCAQRIALATPKAPLLQLTRPDGLRGDRQPCGTNPRLTPRAASS